MELGCLVLLFPIACFFSNGAEEVSAFVRIMRLFLALDPFLRPRASEALLDSAFETF